MHEVILSEDPGLVECRTLGHQNKHLDPWGPSRRLFSLKGQQIQNVHSRHKHQRAEVIGVKHHLFCSCCTVLCLLSSASSCLCPSLRPSLGPCPVPGLCLGLFHALALCLVSQTASPFFPLRRLKSRTEETVTNQSKGINASSMQII